MSRRGDEMKRVLSTMRDGLSDREGKAVSGSPTLETTNISFMKKVLDALDDLNTRIQIMERENAPSDAFVDPLEGSHRVK